MEDVFKLAGEFNTCSGDEGFKYEYDLNKDNAINLLDIIVIARNFNKISRNYPR
jgi:hypothetical protein